MDELCRSLDPVHAGAPIIGARSPQRREYGLTVNRFAPPIFTVTDGAALGIYLLAAIVAGLLIRRRKFGITTPRKRLACWSALRQPVGIVQQRRHDIAVGRRRRAIHAEAKAALNAVDHGIDPVVFGAIGGIHAPCSPHGRGAGLAPGIDVTINAVLGI